MLKKLLTITLFLSGFLAVAETNKDIDEVFENPIEDPGVERPSDYYDKLNERESRDSALKRAKKSYTGPRCEGDDVCEDICRDLYRHGVRDACEKLTIKQVETLKDIDEVFENPSDRDLEGIDSYDLETYLNIAFTPFVNHFSKLNAFQSKRVLAWMLENLDIAEVFRNADNNEYKLLEEMLKAVNRDTKVALTRTITGTDSFIEIAISEEEDETLEWIHDYFDEKCSNEYDWEVCVLQEWYCELRLDNDSWDDLVGNKIFESVANEILSEYECPDCAGYTSAKPGGTMVAWWTDDVEDTDDLNKAYHMKDLCQLRGALAKK